MLDKKGAAELLGVSRSEVDYLIRTEQLAAVQTSPSRVRVTRASLEALTSRLPSAAAPEGESTPGAFPRRVRAH